MFNHQKQLPSLANYQLAHEVVDWQDAGVTLSQPGLHLTPCCSDLNLGPDEDVASSSPRLQEQAVPFMAVFRAQASLSARPGPSFSKHFTVKRPAED